MSDQTFPTSVVNDSGNPNYVNRILVGTPVTGLVRIEWVNGRYGQVIPCNWSMVNYTHFMNSYYPLRWQVADAQNLICKAAIEGKFEWLFLLEHDNVLRPDAFVRLNQYMLDGKEPVVSGLYFTKGWPSEPLVYRGRGNSYFTDWKMGDKIRVDGVPTGCLLIHMSLIRAMWEESEEYDLGGQKTRRVFHTPRDVWFDPETGNYNTVSGTSDLHWCSRVINEGFLAKAGWPEHQAMQYPFLIDTELFTWHIDQAGQRFPLELSRWQR